jgi:hypothetical protein
VELMIETTYVGPPADPRHTGLCCYGVDLAAPLCLAEATWHGYVADDRVEPVAGLECCDQHKPILQQLATWIHPHDTPCGLPEALFYPDLNLCAVPWDEDEMAVAAPELVGARP